MSSRDTLDKVKLILVTKLNLEKKAEDINDDELLFQGGLNLDSLDSLEIIIAVERQFGIKIPDEDLKESGKIFESIRTLSDYIDKLRSK